MMPSPSDCTKECQGRACTALGYAASILSVLYCYCYIDPFFQLVATFFEPQFFLLASMVLLIVKFCFEELCEPLCLTASSMLLFLVLMALALVPTIVVHRGFRFLTLLMFAVGFAHGSYRAYVRTTTIVLVLFFGFHMALLILGFYGEATYLQYTENGVAIRHTLGFLNSNQPLLLAGAIFLGLIILAPTKRTLLLELAVGALFASALFLLTNSRTSFFALMIGIIMIAASETHLAGGFVRAMLAGLGPLGFFAVLALSVSVAILFGEVGNEVSALLSHRPECWLYGLQSADLLWGGNADELGSILNYEVGKVPIDNFYINLLIRQGVFVVAIYGFLFYRFASFCAHKEEWKTLGVLAILLMFGFGENNISMVTGYLFVLPIIHLFSHHLQAKKETGNIVFGGE